MSEQEITLQESYSQVEIGLPQMDRRVILWGKHDTKLLHDGRVNKCYSVKSPGIAYDPETGLSVMLFQAKEPSFKKVENEELSLRTRSNAVLGAKSFDHWQTYSFFDISGADLTDMTEGSSIFTSSDASQILAKNGHIDPRVNVFYPDPNTMKKTYFITVSAFNGEEFETTRKEAGKDLTKPVKGGYLELYSTPDLTNPKSYRSHGFIGPNEYFRNVLIHPVPVIKDNQLHMMIIGRKMPGIQAYYLPLNDFDNIVYDQEFRNSYWDQQLRHERRKNQTILDPIFSWEGKGDKNNPLGQIAGGSPPVAVTYYDKRKGKEVNYWILTYNAVPRFNDGMRGKGRVVGSVLLDYDNPQQVVARSPRPIITPNLEAEFSGDVPNTTFATGAYIGTDRIIRFFSSAADSNIAVTQCKVDSFMEYMTQYDATGKLRI